MKEKYLSLTLKCVINSLLYSSLKTSVNFVINKRILEIRVEKSVSS